MYTTAMIIASLGKIPDKYWHHDPTLSVYDCGINLTVAMLLADRKIIPPREWFHDPNISDEDGGVSYIL